MVTKQFEKRGRAPYASPDITLDVMDFEGCIAASNGMSSEEFTEGEPLVW